MLVSQSSTPDHRRDSRGRRNVVQLADPETAGRNSPQLTTRRRAWRRGATDTRNLNDFAGCSCVTRSPEGPAPELW
jgi:hypothetical protein